MVRFYGRKSDADRLSRPHPVALVRKSRRARRSIAASVEALPERRHFRNWRQVVLFAWIVRVVVQLLRTVSQPRRA